jgi:exodeoxyribonuclease VII large subunit
LDELQARARRAIQRRVELARRSLDACSGQLDSLSPLAVLARGYSLTTRLDDDRLVRCGNDVSAGDRVRTRLRDAELLCRVEDVVPGSVKSGEPRETTRESSEP